MIHAPLQAQHRPLRTGPRHERDEARVSPASLLVCRARPKDLDASKRSVCAEIATQKLLVHSGVEVAEVDVGSSGVVVGVVKRAGGEAQRQRRGENTSGDTANFCVGAELVTLLLLPGG